MSEPTVSLQALRREIARKLRMPFFQRFPTGSTLTGSPTTTALFDSNLTQKDNFWKGDWAYVVDGNAAQEMRLITYFQANNEELGLEYALSSGPSSGDTYEIYSVVSPEEIHQEINNAIQEAHPAFADLIEDESLILEEDTIEYDLTTLTTSPFLVLKIYIEEVGTSLSGTADSGGNNTLTDSDLAGELGDVDSNWKISIYSGTGSGQLRDVSSVNDSTGAVTVSSNWTTNPDSTSDYKLWDPTDEHSWNRLESAQFDNIKNPNTLYLMREYSSHFGFRMRLQYIAQAETLSAEADTTVVPKQYIIYKVLSELAGRFVNDNRFNRRRFASIEEFKRQQAEMYKAQNAFEFPSGTRWVAHNTGTIGGGSHAEPLWGGHGHDDGGFTF